MIRDRGICLDPSIAVLGRNFDRSLRKLNLVVEFVLVESRSFSIRHL